MTRLLDTEFPPTPEHRSWGDGGNRRPSAHRISDLSIDEGWAGCEAGCATVFAIGITLEDAWDIHRGRGDLVSDRALRPYEAELATDSEVADFLRRVGDDPSFEFEGD